MRMLLYGTGLSRIQVYYNQPTLGYQSRGEKNIINCPSPPSHTNNPHHPKVYGVGCLFSCTRRHLLLLLSQLLLTLPLEIFLLSLGIERCQLLVTLGLLRLLTLIAAFLGFLL